jgi:tetratricopeptide (TPR) repeat protein
MTFRLTCCVLLTLTLTVLASAQGGKPTAGGGGSRGTNTGTSRSTGTQTTMGAPDNLGMGQRAFISGKVVLDDGTQLTESANVQTICRGHKQTVTHTDSHGGFSFELGDRMSAAVAGMGSADVDTSGTTASGGRSQRDWHDCEIQAELPGFISQPIDLTSRLSNFDNADVGRLVLHRMAQVEGYTISATSAMAPKDAKKAYEKGREKAAKEKWEEAQQLLTKAVTIYPKYAVAWSDLGRVQMHNNDVVQARHSFEQSIAADPKFTNPYRGLVDLDAQQKQWQPLVTVTGQLLALNPVSFPDAWFRNALGNYYLSNFNEAEKSARQGMRVDDQHQIPKMEYLLGMILIQKHEYTEAATHFQNYLKIANQPSDIEDAQKQLAEISRLLAAVSNPSAAEKK